MRKKRVFYHSDSALAKTGFGRVTKEVLTYLQKTGKYELLSFCCATTNGNEKMKDSLPWTQVGAFPQEYNAKRNDPAAQPLMRAASYGAFTIDNAVKEFKPDIYLGVQDFWGVNFAFDKPWFKKITSGIWVTIDSLPLQDDMISRGKDISNYWVWSNFAEKELHANGVKHAETVHGPLDTSKFFRLSNSERLKLREKHKIKPDDFVIGFVFRNQLRKSVPNLLEGYATWKKQNPEIKNTKLLLHTHLKEGWNIRRLAAKAGIPFEEIIITYICRQCGEYEVKSFDDRGSDKYHKADGKILRDEAGKAIEKEFDEENKDCSFCRTKKAQISTSIGFGVSEEQLNEVYNLMDVYVHPFTSGGQEVPIQEAKLTELITLVTNYSCGEEMCEPEAASLPLEWSKYMEPQSEFIKASTSPYSILKQLDKVYRMPISKRREWGAKARKWVLENFNIEIIGRRIEEWIDSSPYVENEEIWDFKEEPKNPQAEINNDLDSVAWLKEMYKKILNMEVSNDDKGLLTWLKSLEDGVDRKRIEAEFRKVAANKNAEQQQVSLLQLLNKDDKNRVVVIQPKSLGDIILVTSLFKSIRERYPKGEWTFYVATDKEFQDVIEGNPYVDKWIPYHKNMDNTLILEGQGGVKGYFDVVYQPYFGTQRAVLYTHNGKDNLGLDLKY